LRIKEVKSKFREQMGTASGYVPVGGVAKVSYFVKEKRNLLSHTAILKGMVRRTTNSDSRSTYVVHQPAFFFSTFSSSPFFLAVGLRFVLLRNQPGCWLLCAPKRSPPSHRSTLSFDGRRKCVSNRSSADQQIGDTSGCINLPYY